MPPNIFNPPTGQGPYGQMPGLEPGQAIPNRYSSYGQRSFQPWENMPEGEAIPNRNNFFISPYAQGLFGPLVNPTVNPTAPTPAPTQPQPVRPQPRSPFPTMSPFPSGFGPYLQFLGAIPRAIKPNMQAPLAQMFANLLSGGFTSA